MVRILVVDDEIAQRKIMCEILKAAGYYATQAEGVESALEKISREKPAVVLSDLKMNGRSGLDLVQEIGTLLFPPEVVVITAYGTIETAVKAMQAGAYDYLTKPLAHDQLLLVVKRAAEKYALRENTRRLSEELTRQVTEGLVAESSSMRRIMQIASKMAKSDATVLISGETGTGKERIARLIHYSGPRSAWPMQTINCAAFPENLLESELFGFEKGAFTGALARKPGIIETANGSTLFLDEVADMSLSTQAKLLRVLQEKEIRRLGSTETIQVDIRIIAATNKNLQECVKAGTFREDLFYRLNILPILLPPLRERKEDIPSLVRFFLNRRSHDKVITEEALRHLLNYSWPGNIRELEAVMERILVLSATTTISPEDLPSEIHFDKKVTKTTSLLPPEGIVFEDWERSLLEQALTQSNGILADAARLLGMTYRTFQYRAEKFGLI